MKKLYIFLLAMALSGCAAFGKVTPQDRQTVYELEGKSDLALCKAYRFDLASGLTEPAPSMAKLCGVSEGK